jgi:hypothetical protein
MRYGINELHFRTNVSNSVFVSYETSVQDLKWKPTTINSTDKRRMSNRFALYVRTRALLPYCAWMTLHGYSWPFGAPSPARRIRLTVPNDSVDFYSFRKNDELPAWNHWGTNKHLECGVAEWGLFASVDLCDKWCLGGVYGRTVTFSTNQQSYLWFVKYCNWTSDERTGFFFSLAKLKSSVSSKMGGVQRLNGGHKKLD